VYPASEVRAAARAARAAGVAVENDEGHAVVRLLERRGYLPRDRARVDALVDRVTREARVRVRAARGGPEQLALPLWGRWVDDPVETVQLALPL
jgi:hypothetical protein